MVQFITYVRHFKSVDDFRVGWTVRVGVDGTQIVRLLDAGAGIDGDGVKDFLTRGLHGLAWARISRTATFHDLTSFRCPPTLQAISPCGNSMALDLDKAGKNAPGRRDKIKDDR